MTMRRPFRALVGPALALVLGAAAACSQQAENSGIASAGGATPTVTQGAGTEYADPNARFDVHGWVRCLRQHGVPVDDPVEDPKLGPHGEGKPMIHEERVSAGEFRAAVEACRSFNPNYGKPSRPEDQQEEREKMRRFAQCMRAHGVDWADPEPEGGPASGGPGPTGPTPGGPAFDRAWQACAREVPGVVVDPTGPKG
jgi:hypothetical protein